MTLRKQTLLTVSGILCITIFVLYLFLSYLVKDRFARLEREHVSQNVSRVAGALSDTLEGMNSKTGDWANWDDAYRFAAGENPDFAETNLPENALMELGVNALVMLYPDCSVMAERYVDLRTRSGTGRPEGLSRLLTSGSPLCMGPDTTAGAKGIVMLPGGPMLVTAKPILTSRNQGPMRGTLLFGRLLDADEISRLSGLTKLSLALERIDGEDGPAAADFREAHARILEGEKTPIVEKSNDVIEGFRALTDLNGRPAFMIRVDLPRDIHHQGERSLFYVVTSLLALAFVSIVLLFFLIDRLILRRLKRLSRNVTDIGEHKSFSERVEVVGSDELAITERKINEMLERLDQAHDSLTFERQQLISIFESIDEVIYVSDPQTYEILFANQALKNAFGQDIEGKTCYRVLQGIEEPCSFCTNRRIFGDDLGKPFVWDFHNFKLNKWFHCIDRAIKWPDGRWVRHEIAIDITERKLAEERLEYLSSRDSLTGLFNRLYFERMMAEQTEPPVGVIMCDVDGLKLVNDTLGHSAGDAMLKNAGRIIRKCFRSKDFVCRIGGDEFAVILPESTPEATSAAANRIHAAVAAYSTENPALPMSISVGHATAEGLPVVMETALKEADRAMYRHKLLQARSARSAIVATLLKTLEEHDEHSERHAMRLNSYARVIAASLGMPESSFADIELFARFHDIGKIGIPDSILTKNGPLTPEEYALMKTHSEIGARIAMSAPDLAHLAHLIRHHHEWWDGSGYPDGLHGNDIPVECRILSIADSFDAMTSDRPYRKAMTRDAACMELRKFAGTQFEPRLVELFLDALASGEV